MLKVVVDRVQLGSDDARQRLTDSIETAYLEGGGAAWTLELAPQSPTPSPGSGSLRVFSERFECRTLPEQCLPHRDRRHKAGDDENNVSPAEYFWLSLIAKAALTAPIIVSASLIVERGGPFLRLLRSGVGGRAADTRMDAMARDCAHPLGAPVLQGHEARPVPRRMTAAAESFWNRAPGPGGCAGRRPHRWLL